MKLHFPIRFGRRNDVKFPRDGWWHYTYVRDGYKMDGLHFWHIVVGFKQLQVDIAYRPDIMGYWNHTASIEFMARLRYQNLVYSLCSIFDRFEGRSVSQIFASNGTTIDQLEPKLIQALKVLNNAGLLHKARIEEGATCKGKGCKK